MSPSRMLEREHPLAAFQRAPNQFRFESRRYLPFAAWCVVVAVLGWLVFITRHEMDLFGIVAALTMAGGVTWWALTFAHWHHWFEIDDRGTAFSLRGRYGLRRWSHEVPKNRVAVATIEERVSFGVLGTRNYRHVAVHLIDPPEFSRTRTPPILLGLHDMPAPVALAICKLLAPGLTETSYLLHASVEHATAQT